MPLPPEAETKPAAPADLPTAEGTAAPGPRARGGRLVWLIAAAAIPQSLIAAKLLNTVFHPGGMLPGIAFLMLLVIGTVWLAVVWGLVALAAFVRRPTFRFVVLALLLLPDFWCVPILVADAGAALAYREPDIETGWGYFDDQAARDLEVAIRACNPGMQRYGLVCDLDKVASLARTTGLYAFGLMNDSQMTLALQNGPNPDVLRILLRTQKPPEEVLQMVLYKAIAMRDVTLLRAELDAGLDPNGLADSVNPVLFLTAGYGWVEGVAALLEAGAKIDQTDSAGFTVLMQSIADRHYDLAAMLLARGAAEDRVASYDRTMETLVAKIPPEDREKMPPSVVAMTDRHRPQ